MTDPKPSTNDILAKIRSQGTGGSDGGASPGGDAADVKESADSQPAAPAAPAKPAAAPTPGKPSDILAAIRKQGAGAEAPASEAAAAKPAAAAGAAAPKGTSDIMASIRGGGGPAAAAAPPAAAAAKPKPKAVDPAAASGMSAADMIKAARTGQKPADVPGAAPVALPKKPLASKAKPPFAPPASRGDAEPRRSFLGRAFAVVTTPIVVAWASFAAVTATSLLATARFMMPNVLVEPPTRFKIGPPSDYAPGTVSTKWQAQFAIWVVNGEVDGEQLIYALSTVCTHLGCTPNWLEGEQKFKCPCHGSGFYKTGVNFEGPAPRPLERMGIRLAEDGMLEVDKSVKFQKELGQWDNPASYVPIV